VRSVSPSSSIHCRQTDPIVEFATMTLHPETKQPLAKIYRPSELDELLRKLELGGKQEDKVEAGEGTGGGGGGEGNVAMST
jgi:20S proteasome subunit alpha 3